MNQVGLSAAILLITGLVAAQGQDSRAEDPSALVFVQDKVGAGEGAPPAANLGTLVLLTDLGKQDDYYPVVELLQQQKKPVATVRFPAGKIGKARAKLKRLLPEFVIVVTRPDHIDANSHFELLELAASLDADPFVDFTFGYVTGATAEEALGFAQRILQVGKKKAALPRTLFEFGPSKDKALHEGGPVRHNMAKGWKKTWVYHGSAEQMRERTDDLSGHGALQAAGHGEPDRVVDGLTARELREHRFDLSPAVYFSGPCYCGVTGSHYRWQQGGVQEQVVDPMESFALAVIASGVSGLFAGLDPDRAEQSSQELEHLFVHGDALGHAIKETYDGASIALRRSEFELFRYKKGGARPQRTLSMTMIGGGAGRALFGDPTMIPFGKCAKSPFPAKVKNGKKSLKVSWKSRQRPSGWLAVDVYRCAGRWTNRVALREKIPVKVARALDGFEVKKLVTKQGDLPRKFATAMIERWGGEAWLHVYVVAEPGGWPTDARDFEAEFEFAK